VNTLSNNLLAIKNEIRPTQLVLSTVPYSNVVKNEKIDELNGIITKFARDNALPVVDFHQDVVLKDTEYKSDGHYTADGYAKIAKDITSQIT
jgi:lysophospholipase L1-like esterase